MWKKRACLSSGWAPEAAAQRSFGIEGGRVATPASSLASSFGELFGEGGGFVSGDFVEGFAGARGRNAGEALAFGFDAGRAGQPFRSRSALASNYGTNTIPVN
jgi:hypothetical protein